jgi:nucleotide-binding universal stress UspA family protein
VRQASLRLSFEFSMLNIKKILLPVDFPNTSLHVIHQAAAIARHFRSEIVMLHVLTPQSHLAGVPESAPELARWDMLEEITRRAEESLDQTLRPELEGLAIQCVLVRGAAAKVIVQLSQEEEADLIMMPSSGPTFFQFLAGSATAQLERGTGCPVWTDASAENLPAKEFAIRSVVCAVEFNPNDHKSVPWAAQIAAEFDARLTLAHVTPGVERWGPGGIDENPRWKEELVSDASQQIAELQNAMGTKADVFIGSGNVPALLNHAAKQTKADLLVTGCYPYGGRLRTHGYSIICAVPIPILNV